MSAPARRRLGAITFLVRDYDEAAAWLVETLGFRVTSDVPLGEGKRWVTAGPEEGGCALVLARATTDQEIALVGNQGGGRVAFFLETDDFARDHARMSAFGVRFEEEPRREGYGMVAVFRDLYGNKWDLIEPIRARDAPST